jgi:predicted kinase
MSKDAVIFIGIQATGKSTFYRERFFRTHVRINLDMLRTRRREEQLFNACLEAGQSLAIDNTNCTQEDRCRYIPSAKKAGFRVVGYYFKSSIEDCLRRNAERPADEVIPEGGLFATHGKMELPSQAEGFDELFYVRIGPDHTFVIEEWRHEV